MREAAAGWWNALPEDLYLQPDSTELDVLHPLKVHGTAALDHVLRTGLGSLMASALALPVLSRRHLQREEALLSFYRERACSPSGEVFPTPAQVLVRGGKLRRSGRKQLQTRLLRFDSPFQPLHPELRPAWRRYASNRTAFAQHWTHPDGPRKTLLFVHGFVADRYWLNARMFALRWLYRAGYDILLPTLPFHGARRAWAEPFSGYGYFAHGLASLNESMLNAIHDLRVWLDYLEARGTPGVGVSGLSLGGYLSALLASVDGRLSYCIPNSPVVSPVDMARDWLPLRWLVHATMRRTGIGVEQLRQALALHSPLSYQPKLAPEKLLIIGGAGDRLTPPRLVRLLHAHWQGSAIHWFPGNHVVHLQQGKYLRLMRGFMDRHSA
jgi:acetyl esterase/lipase